MRKCVLINLLPFEGRHLEQLTRAEDNFLVKEKTSMTKATNN